MKRTILTLSLILAIAAAYPQKFIGSVIAGGKFVMKNRIVESEKDILHYAREVLRQIR